jgi:phosphate transport system protein
MQHLDHDLNALKQALLDMGAKAKGVAQKAVTSALNRDDEAAQEAKRDDDAIDQLEVDVDEKALFLLSKAPLAGQLRFITVAMKISQNLERIGDEATTIARRAIELAKEPELKSSSDLPYLAKLTIEMIDDALLAFIHGNVEQARELVAHDKVIDDLNRQLHRELIQGMQADPSTITRALNLMIISKSLERIADHAANIAEEAVFLYSAEDVRHASLPRPLT